MGGINVFLQEHVPAFRHVPRVMRRWLDSNAAAAAGDAARRQRRSSPVGTADRLDAARRRRTAARVRARADPLPGGRPRARSRQHPQLAADRVWRRPSSANCRVPSRLHAAGRRPLPRRPRRAVPQRSAAAHPGARRRTSTRSSRSATTAPSGWPSTSASTGAAHSRRAARHRPRGPRPGHARSRRRSRSATWRASPRRRGCTSSARRTGSCEPRLACRRAGLLVAGYLAPEHRGVPGRRARSRWPSGDWPGSSSTAANSTAPASSPSCRNSACSRCPSPATTQKGLFLLEAMASGVPVVQPRLGVFTEVVERTGGGLLTTPGDTDDWVREHPRPVAGRRAQEAARRRGVRRACARTTACRWPSSA